MLDKLEIQGGLPLYGNVMISGAKNAALPLIAASLLSDEGLTLTNIPDVQDIRTMVSALKIIGMDGQFSGNTLTLKPSDLNPEAIPYDIVRKMRASVLLMGPSLARFGEAHVYTPGGCAIGTRPIDLHIKAFEKMGAKHKIQSGFSNLVTGGKLSGGHVAFDKVTVTGTENVLMGAVLAEGTTTIDNAATEPEVADLCYCLVKMGAEIDGIGTRRLTVQGVKTLHHCEHEVIPDRIEAGTFLIAAAVTGGDVRVKKCCPEHLTFFIEKLKDAGVIMTINDNEIHIHPTCEIKAVDIKTAPYPGFPTDLQAQFMTLMMCSDGVSHIKELIFENRFQHALELKRLGADIQIDGSLSIVKGDRGNLTGADVMATDLRASASLVLAGLVSGGITHVHRIYHLDRGYEKLDEKLKNLGAKIKRTRE